MAILDQEDMDAILEAIRKAMSPSGELAIGNGLGTQEYIGYLLGVDEKPLSKAVVRMFPYDSGTVDFTDCKARGVTENDGRFVMYLDPGEYVMRVERAGTLVLTKVIEIVEG